jgi:myo-inositol-1(or 4)-monophosphatase
MQTGSIFAANIKLLKPLMQTVVPVWGSAVKG